MVVFWLIMKSAVYEVLLCLINGVVTLGTLKKSITKSFDSFLSELFEYLSTPCVEHQGVFFQV